MTNRSARPWLLFVLLTVAGPGLLSAQGGEGGSGARTEGAPFLLLPSGARAVGLAGAVSTLASAESVYWNPAGLAGLRGRRGVLTRGEHVTGDALGVSLQMGVEERGAVALSYQLLDEGTLDLTDIDGNVIGSFSLRNHLAVVTAATTLGRRLQAGASLKYLRFEFGCRGQCPEGGSRSSSWAVDLGVQGRPRAGVPVQLGASLLHLGPAFRNADTGAGDPLPARVRLGASWEPWSHVIEEERLAVELAVDVEERLRDLGDPAVLLGVEFSAGSSDRVYIRGGYTLRGSTGLEGAAAGFGIRVDRLELDVARALPRGAIASQQEPVHLTLALGF